MFSYSRLSPDALLTELSQTYALTAQAQCRYYTAGLHDNYLVVDGALKYIARVYRKPWRSNREIAFELELLNYLQQQACPVAQPLTATTGQLYIRIAYPEGDRAVALFHYAPGEAPGNAISPKQSHRLGQTVATVHQQADRYVHTQDKQALTLDYLLDASVAAISSFLSEAQRTYVQRLRNDIHTNLPDLPLTPPFYGLCIGDVSPRNFHVTEQGALTLFDFDQCGYGWRAFEVGKYFATISALPQSRQLGDSFRQGYDSVRVLRQDEITAVPWFMMVAEIWVMGMHASNAEYLGAKHIGPDFWARKISRLEQCKQDPVILS